MASGASPDTPEMAANVQSFIPTFSSHREMLVVSLATMTANQTRGSWERKWGEMKGKSLSLQPCLLRSKGEEALLIHGCVSMSWKTFNGVSFEQELPSSARGCLSPFTSQLSPWHLGPALPAAPAEVEHSCSWGVNDFTLHKARHSATRSAGHTPR